jgi:hypothetical protein
MQVDKITFTGADDNTSLLDLSNISKLCPFVELGILFSKSKEGQSRYPSQSKRDYFAAMGIPMSAHFCGWYSKEVLEKSNYKIMEGLEGFQRIQINYNFSNSIGWDVRPLLDWAVIHPEKSIIFQVNKANQKTIDFIDGSDIPENIHFLYDSSGGRGSVIGEIKPTYKNYTGYSGGLNPDNIESVVKLISDYPNPRRVWVDMESGVRTGDHFDIDKCLKVIDIFATSITPNSGDLTN